MTILNLALTLTSIDDEEQLVIASFLPHLFKGVGQLLVHDLFGILEFQESVSSVTRHVDEHVRPKVEVSVAVELVSIFDVSSKVARSCLADLFNATKQRLLPRYLEMPWPRN